MSRATFELHQTVAEAVRLQVEPILEEMRALRRELALAQQTRKVRTVTDICTEFGYGRATVLRNPWLMPNWGRSDYPSQVRKWKPETYAEWFAVGADQRRREWDSLPIKKKDAIIKGGNR